MLLLLTFYTFNIESLIIHDYIIVDILYMKQIETTIVTIDPTYCDS